MSTDRIILHASIASSFLSALKESLASKPTDAPLPRLVTAASKTRVENLVSSSLASGSKLLNGSPQLEANENGTGKANKAINIIPTILTDVKEEMPIWQDEAFAPLAACMIVESDEDAVAMANRGGYGLSASVFTEDLRKGLRIAKVLESGLVIMKLFQIVLCLRVLLLLGGFC